MSENLRGIDFRDLFSSRRTRRDVLILGGLVSASLIVGCADSEDEEPVSQATPIVGENSTPLEQKTSPELDPSVGKSLEVNLTPEMQEKAGEEFLKSYEEFKLNYLLGGGEGTSRVLYDPEAQNTALEVQSFGELFAVSAGDEETLREMFSYDKRYIKPNGLMSWLIDENGEIEDETAVSAVMMLLAGARLMSENHKEEGRKLLQSIKENLINPSTNIPQAFDTPGSRDLTNPAYWSPYLLELFAREDPYWNEVASACRGLFASLDEQIQNGEIVYFPNWVDMEGNPTNDPNGNPPNIDYDTAVIPILQMMGALYLTDEEAISDSKKQSAYANDFFYSIIKVSDGEYDVLNLKDGYNLDGSLREDETRYSLTAFVSGAAIASLVSEDAQYRDYMFEQLIALPTDPVQVHPHNNYIRTLALLTLSGKLGGSRS